MVRREARVKARRHGGTAAYCRRILLLSVSVGGVKMAQTPMLFE